MNFVRYIAIIIFTLLGASTTQSLVFAAARRPAAPIKKSQPVRKHTTVVITRVNVEPADIKVDAKPDTKKETPCTASLKSRALNKIYHVSRVIKNQAPRVIRATYYAYMICSLCNDFIDSIASNNNSSNVSSIATQVPHSLLAESLIAEKTYLTTGLQNICYNLFDLDTVKYLIGQ